MGRYLLGFCGLALCAGPLFAQDYIDLERERLQQQDDPPLAVPLPEPATVAADPVSPGSNIGEIFYQMQLMQEEVMDLRGLVEELTYEMRQLKSWSTGLTFMSICVRIVDFTFLPRNVPDVGAAARGTWPDATAT